jgi:type VI secretion system secreted protein VgrG
MTNLKFRAAGSSATSPIDQTRRKEIRIRAPACWVGDHEVEINTSTDVYRKVYDRTGTEYSLNVNAKYKIYIPLKSQTDVIVEVRFRCKFEPAPLTTERQVAAEAKIRAAQKVMADGITAYWNQKFKLRIVDPLCGERILAIRYTPVWVSSNEHYILQLQETHPREMVSGDYLEVGTTTDEWTYAHEFAHCVGVPDEYSYSQDTETIRFIKPDGSLDEPKILMPDGQGRPEADRTIMSDERGHARHYHAWNIAIEVRKILQARLSRPITCDII